MIDRRLYRISQTGVVVAVALGLACIDMSAPKGPAWISVLQVPSPAVVVGDTMRDSNGVATPLNIGAFDGSGAPISAASAQFFITDSAPAAHLNQQFVLVGDKLGTIHVIGQIGALQTPVATVFVTVAPTRIAAAGPVDTLRVPVTGDTTTSTAFSVLAVTVHGVGDTASQGFVVKFVLKSAPATIAGQTTPAVYLADDLGNPSTADTTDAVGASRRLVVKQYKLADQALAGGQKTDSAVVEASTSYKGVLVSGSPVRFVVPIKIALSIPTP